MACPHCTSTETISRQGTSSPGHARFVCHACGRRFNERTGTAFSDLHYPTNVVINVVLWRLRYKLSLHDVAELLLIRGLHRHPRDQRPAGRSLRSAPCRPSSGEATGATKRLVVSG